MIPTRTLLLMGSLVASTAAFATELDGVWARGDGKARVRIAACGDKICATNIWVRDASDGEAVGDRLVMNVKKQPNGTMTGSAYDAKRGWNMSMTITLAGNRFTSQGCLLGGMVCKSMNWSK